MVKLHTEVLRIHIKCIFKRYRLEEINIVGSSTFRQSQRSLPSSLKSGGSSVRLIENHALYVGRAWLYRLNSEAIRVRKMNKKEGPIKIIGSENVFYTPDNHCYYLDF